MAHVKEEKVDLEKLILNNHKNIYIMIAKSINKCHSLIKNNEEKKGLQELIIKSMVETFSQKK